MNNILLVNPRLALADLGNKVDLSKVKIFVVITKDERNFLTAEQASLYEIHSPDTLPNDIDFVCALSSDVLGFKFIETLKNKVLLSNSKSQSEARIKSFYVGRPTESATVIETFSFFGRHVVSSAWDYDCVAYTLIDPASMDNWDDLVDQAFEFLESIGYINGPSQIFLNKDLSIAGAKFQMFDGLTEELGIDLTGRHWLSHWPAVIVDENKNNKGFFKRYYEWSRNLGNNRKYVKAKDFTYID